MPESEALGNKIITAVFWSGFYIKSKAKRNHVERPMCRHSFILHSRRKYTAAPKACAKSADQWHGSRSACSAMGNSRQAAEDSACADGC